jgi:hypothetical protein
VPVPVGHCGFFVLPLGLLSQTVHVIADTVSKIVLPLDAATADDGPVDGTEVGLNIIPYKRSCRPLSANFDEFSCFTVLPP